MAETLEQRISRARAAYLRAMLADDLTEADWYAGLVDKLLDDLNQRNRDKATA